MIEIESQIEESWRDLLKTEINSPLFKGIKDFLVSEKMAHFTFYPSESDIFKAFRLTPVPKVKVVLLGQDPYHGQGQAEGLSFSVSEKVKVPPSLKNILKELKTDLGIERTHSGSLESWARQGVLLLNSTLTVRANLAGSHQNQGWEEITDAVIEKISSQRENIVFLLWGKYAQAKEDLIDKKKHLVLKAAHPSPFSAHRGFIGCKHFSKTNEYLRQKGMNGIDWSL